MSSLEYTYTFTGFGTQVLLNSQQTICTGATINFGQKIINSQGSFFGGVNFSQDELTIQTNTPPRMDIPQITVDLSFQMTTQLMSTFLDMLTNRKSNVSIEINVGDQTISLEKCYWNKISLQVQQNSLMTGSVSFNVIQEYQTVYNYVLYASQSTFVNQSNFGLYGDNFECNLIPYYATSVIDTDSLLKPTAWSLDLSQQISFKTFCKNISSSSDNTDSSVGAILLAPIPNHIVFGMLNCNFNVTTLIDDITGSSFTSTSQYISIQETTLSSESTIDVKYYVPSEQQLKLFVTLGFLQLISATPVLADTSNYLSYQLNYQVNKLTIEQQEQQ